MKQKPDDLESRVASRKREIIIEIIEHKRNPSRYGAAEAIGKMTDHLSELAQILGVGRHCDLSAGARQRLALWVTR